MNSARGDLDDLLEAERWACRVEREQEYANSTAMWPTSRSDADVTNDDDYLARAVYLYSLGLYSAYFPPFSRHSASAVGTRVDAVIEAKRWHCEAIRPQGNIEFAGPDSKGE